jgi:hypothetical protein
MALLDWILVAFGAIVAFAGGWIQLHPERIYPRPAESWPLDAAALTQLRRLGACFLFMGAFFTFQMTVDLVHLPWWSGTVAGLIVAFMAVSRVQRAVQVRQRSRRPLQQGPLPKKPLEVR